MPLFLILVGILLIDVAIRNTYMAFFTTTKNIIVGGKEPNQIAFWQWGLAIFIIASIGYWQKARPVVVSFIILIFIIMLLSSNSKTLSALQNITKNL